ncbi:MAG: hypothetical protein GEU80_07115 [Dehalococcoidia bacterium]|nr:hypothetical protein [Dehalococcoidia bacterium]
MNDTHSDADRYVLTELGMRYLAARAGTPPGTFARHGGVTFVEPEESDRPERVLRHREHTIGVNRFFVLLADARRAGWQLDEWRNEAESTHRFIDQDDRTSWIRPDGAGVLRHGAAAYPFLLEYDRGTLDAGDYRAKFEGYRRYYHSEAWREAFRSEPVLLFVCADSRAEYRVAQMVRAANIDLPVMLASERRVARHPSNADGILGSVWRNPRRDGWLQAFPGLSAHFHCDLETNVAKIADGRVDRSDARARDSAAGWSD